MSTQVPRIDISSLIRETELGSGGQGKVQAVSGLLVSGRWPAAVKTYSRELADAVDTYALEEIIRFPRQLNHAEGDWLTDTMAWPAVLVEDNGVICGFLMRRVPPEYYFSYQTRSQGGKQKLADLAFLLNPDSYVAQLGIAVSDRDRIALVEWLAGALSRLHGLGVVVGDLSPKNLLFRLTPSPGCFIIDCDAMQVQGQSVLRQVQTPDWETPAGEPATTPASDVYKLGLLAIRLFARDQSTRDPASLAAISPRLGQLARQSLSRNPAQRPQPGEWEAPLQDARLSVSAAPTMPVLRPSVPSSRISVPIPAVSAGIDTQPAQTPPASARAAGTWSRARTAAFSGAIAGIVGVTLLVAILLYLHQPALRTSAAGSSSTSPPSAAGQQAAQIDGLLTTSTASRGSLQAAVNDVSSCSDLPGAVSAITSVASQRKAEFAKASAFSTGSLPNGAALKSDLVHALRYSLQADEDFLRWARHQMNAGCSAPAPLTSAYRAGFSKSKQAVAAKTAFIRLWNPIAAQHGLAARSQNAI